MDGGRGTVSFLVQGQQPNAAPSSFTGSRVPLTDVLFRVKAGVAPDAPVITTMSVGSLLDPVYLGAVASNGDDVSKAQSIAQVRSLARNSEVDQASMWRLSSPTLAATNTARQASR